MDRRTFLKTVPAVAILAGTASGSAEDLKPIALVKPQTDGGKSMLAALKERKTNRNIGSKELAPQTLSNLLWAAFGVNRDDSPFRGPGRTAASASNSQEIDLYVALPGGVYLYEAVPHRLRPVAAGDFRRRSGRRSAAGAPVFDMDRRAIAAISIAAPFFRVDTPEVKEKFIKAVIKAAKNISQRLGHS